jgi:8-oxo-dGTP diphosphatase
MSAANAARRDVRLRVAVRAAGGLVVRRGTDDDIRVVVVHRPAYDDWSFPKGKQRRGETLQTAALREVHEETGFFCAAEAVLGVTEYVDRKDRPKLVRYWAMSRIAGSFEPNGEVDEIAWLRPSEAMLRLTRDRDRDLLASALPQLEGVLERRDRAETLSLG